MVLMMRQMIIKSSTIQSSVPICRGFLESDLNNSSCNDNIFSLVGTIFMIANIAETDIENT